jgi:hypothetical protein
MADGYKDFLLGLINELLSGALSVSEFRDRYYYYYLENIPDDGISDSDRVFFGLVQENLDWTAADPDPIARKYGWMNHTEFIEWLGKQLRNYQNGLPITYPRATRK